MGLEGVARAAELESESGRDPTGRSPRTLARATTRYARPEMNCELPRSCKTARAPAATARPARCPRPSHKPNRSLNVKAPLAAFPFAGRPCLVEFPRASARVGYPAVSVECPDLVSLVRLPSVPPFAGKRCAIVIVPKAAMREAGKGRHGGRRRWRPAQRSSVTRQAIV